MKFSLHFLVGMPICIFATFFLNAPMIGKAFAQDKNAPQIEAFFAGNSLEYALSGTPKQLYQQVLLDIEGTWIPLGAAVTTFGAEGSTIAVSRQPRSAQWPAVGIPDAKEHAVKVEVPIAILNQMFAGRHPEIPVPILRSIIGTFSDITISVEDSVMHITGNREGQPFVATCRGSDISLVEVRPPFFASGLMPNVLHCIALTDYTVSLDGVKVSIVANSGRLVNDNLEILGYVAR